MWSKWRYSDVVEYALNKMNDIKNDSDDIADADIEYSEQLIAMSLLKILQKL